MLSLLSVTAALIYPHVLTSAFDSFVGRSVSTKCNEIFLKHIKANF